MVDAEVHPTEDHEKVKHAINNLFPGTVELESVDGNYGRATLNIHGVHSLEKFRMILQRDRIRAAARAVLYRSIDENNEMTVFLNKQAAHAGHISFSEREGESPLGPIRVHIKTSNASGLIDWLTGASVKKSMGKTG